MALHFFLFAIRALILITADLFHLPLREGWSRSGFVSGAFSPHTGTGTGANIPHHQGRQQIYQMAHAEPRSFSRLPTYHCQVLVDTLASPYRERLRAIDAASNFSRAAFTASEKHELMPAGGNERWSLCVFTVFSDSQDSFIRLVFSHSSQSDFSSPADFWLEELRSPLWVRKTADFRLVVILQSGNTNNKKFQWLKSSVSVLSSRSYIFCASFLSQFLSNLKDEGAEWWVTLGRISIPAVLAVLPCGSAGLWATDLLGIPKTRLKH